MRQDLQPPGPLDSQRPAPQVTRWTLVALLFSTPAGLFVLLSGAGKWVGCAVILGPVFAVLALEDALAGPAVVDAPSAPASPQPVVTSLGPFVNQCLVSTAALFAGVAVAVVTSWFSVPWLCVPAGLLLTIGLRRHRGRSGMRAAFAFAGIPLAVYGLLATALRMLQ